MSNKYEQLVEFIINDETDKARELFHKIVVEKSRDIYESLVSEEDLEETIGGNEVEGMVRDVQMDEEGMNEEEDEYANEFNSEEDSEEDEDFGHEEEGEFGHDEASEEERITDLEDALDQLKAEFDALMADEAHEPEHNDGVDDPDFGSDAAPEEFYEAAEEDDEEDDEEEEEEDLEESIVREYVEKVADTGQKNPTGKMSASGARTPQSGDKNTKSVVAGKNDMGGSAVTSKGGNQDQDGTRPASHPNPKGTLVSNPQNKPGANAGKTAFKTKEAGHGAEKKSGAEGKLAGADGSRPINKVSPVRK